MYPTQKSQRDSLKMIQYIRHPIESIKETKKVREFIQEDKKCKICQHLQPIKFSFFCREKLKYVMSYNICKDFTEKTSIVFKLSTEEKGEKK